ncbi:MAG: cell division protein FtsA [Sphingomonadales bacterium]
MPRHKNELIAALDVGTSKICCFIARVDAAGGINVIGIGHQVSDGIRAGVVVDIDAVETSVRAAVDGAERMAGQTIGRVFVNLSGVGVRSQTVGVEVAIDGHEVGEADLRLALEHGRGRCDPGEQTFVHVLPVGYAVDGTRGIRDPRAMHGNMLGVDLHVVTAPIGPVRNIETCLARGHLGLQGVAASAYAAGLASLVEDELELGATCIDLGGGTTSIAVFAGGAMVYTAVIPVGGNHVTNDIAHGMVTSTRQAERLKTLHGGALAGPSDDRETIDIPQVGEGDSAHRVARSMLNGIIRPRLEEIFEMVRDRLVSDGFNDVAGKRVVLTGGASQLQGMREFAARMLNKRVRLGRPIHVSGLAEATAGPAFASCAGLLTYAQRLPQGAGQSLGGAVFERSPRRLARVGRWLKENF